jgi:peroxidase
MLKTSDGLPKDHLGLTKRSYLPLANDKCSRDSSYHCFLAGEYRTSENLALVSMHTLFNREHNRIAKELASVRSDWDDEKLYFETRKIIIAILQHIAFSEWIPIISGNKDLMPIPIDSENLYYGGYDKMVSTNQQ